MLSKNVGGSTSGRGFFFYFPLMAWLPLLLPRWSKKFLSLPPTTRLVQPFTPFSLAVWCFFPPVLIYTTFSIMLQYDFRFVVWYCSMCVVWLIVQNRVCTFFWHSFTLTTENRWVLFLPFFFHYPYSYYYVKYPGKKIFYRWWEIKKE